MDKPDVSSLLGELEPTTEYTEFLNLWPSIKEARDRGVRLKAIYEKLTDNKLLSVSYVTFTRFVKKAADENPSETARSVRQKSEVTDKAVAGNEPGEAETPKTDVVESTDSAAAPARDALEEAKKVSSSKNYARNIRRGQ